MCVCVYVCAPPYLKSKVPFQVKLHTIMFFVMPTKIHTTQSYWVGVKGVTTDFQVIRFILFNNLHCSQESHKRTQNSWSDSLCFTHLYTIHKQILEAVTDPCLHHSYSLNNVRKATQILSKPQTQIPVYSTINDAMPLCVIMN